MRQMVYKWDIYPCIESKTKVKIEFKLNSPKKNNKHVPYEKNKTCSTSKVAFILLLQFDIYVYFVEISLLFYESPSFFLRPMSKLSGLICRFQMIGQSFTTRSFENWYNLVGILKSHACFPRMHGILE